MSDRVYFNKKELKTVLKERIFPLIAAIWFGFDIAALGTGANPIIFIPLTVFMGFGTWLGFYYAYMSLVKSVRE